MTYNPFPENEVSENSSGGTELTKRGVAAGIDPALAENFQVVASRPRELLEDKIRVFWLHDLPEDTEVSSLKTEEGRSKWHKMVYSSHWQHQQYVNRLGLPWSTDSVVIETAVDPIPVHVKPKEETRLIYFSTPNRGLQLLVPVFKKLAETRPDVHLDVFSSFEIYGWKQMDEQFESLYEECRQHPQITYHGFKSNEFVREALQKSHVLAYPSIWEETSCRCLIESMSAGLMCVHPAYGALPDTSGGLTMMYAMDQDPNTHASAFLSTLQAAVDRVHEDDVQNYLKYVKNYADTRFSTRKIQALWTSFMQSTLQQYPTVDSRKYRKLVEVFKYRT